MEKYQEIAINGFSSFIDEKHETKEDLEIHIWSLRNMHNAAFKNLEGILWNNKDEWLKYRDLLKIAIEENELKLKNL